MTKIVFATENPGKISEIQLFASQFNVEVLRPSEAGFKSISVEETGTTYEENARLKVEAYLSQAAAKDFIICGDDAGMEIPALDNEPGIHTRRWLDGVHQMTDDEIVGYTLGRLHGVVDRTVNFKSTVAYSKFGAPIEYVTGEMHGQITELPFYNASDESGLPFRKITTVDGEPPLPLWRFHDLSLDERGGRLSHREQAFKKLFETLQ